MVPHPTGLSSETPIAQVACVCACVRACVRGVSVCVCVMESKTHEARNAPILTQNLILSPNKGAPK